MTTATTAPALRRPPHSTSSTFGILLRFRFRRDRVQLLIWFLTFGLLVVASGSAVVSTFGDEAQRLLLVQLAAGNPALLMLRGIPQGTGIGSLVFFQIFTYLGLLAALMNTFLAVRQSRADEETGRAELIGSTPAGRSTPSLATLVEGITVNVILVILVTAAGVASTLELSGSLVMGLATGAVGLTFLGVGLIAAELMQTSRGANGLAAAVVGCAYLLRAVGDAGGTASPDGLSVTSAWPSWLSPIGWGQQTHAFTENSLLPLLLNLGLAVLLVGLVFRIQTDRDLADSVLGERTGRSHAARSLSSVLGLSFRLLRGSVIGWAIGAAVLGIFAGSLGKLISEAIAENPSLQTTIDKLMPGGAGSIADLFVAAMFGFVGILAAACAVQVMMRLRQEEVSGTTELLLARPVGRLRWLLGYVQMAVAGVLVVAVAGAAAAAVGFFVTDGNADRLGDAFLAAGAQIPAALVYLALMMVVVVIVPKATMSLGWGALTLGLLVGQLGALIGLPEWVRDLSPFTHSPVEPAATANWSGAWWMLFAAAALAAFAIVMIRKRELTA